jgi:SsrA-binding protein
MGIKVVANNRKAKHEYFLLDTYEAGIVLQGSEIKSIRAGQLSLAQAYVSTDGQEAWLINAHVAPYDQASRFNHDPLRRRKLLLHRSEIKKLYENVRQKGATIIPLRVYLKDGIAKVEIALAKGKKHYDKRTEIAKRDVQRELDRRYKHSR